MPKPLILVEGSDDEHVVRNLLLARGIASDTFEIKTPKGTPSGGLENLLEVLPIYLKSSTERLAVLVDADEHVDRRWDQLRYRVRATSNVELGPTPISPGAVVAVGSQRRLGIWLMPNNESPGMLEDFAAALIPSEDRLLPRVDAFLHGIPDGERRFATRHLPKARIHSWLAIQEEPGRPLGRAITMKYLDPASPSADAFVAWLGRVLWE